MAKKIEIDVTGLTTEAIEEVKRFVEAKRQDKTNGHHENGARTANDTGATKPAGISELGQRLRQRRKAIEQSGILLLSEDELEEEVRSRRSERFW